MENFTRIVCRLVLTVLPAFIFFLAGADWRVLAQSGEMQGAHAPPPGGHKSSLKDRYLWRVKPLHIIGNVYFVGMSDVDDGDFSSYLITSPKGDFLIDVTIAEETRKSIEELGFKVSDIKYLLEAHNHNDHVLGLADMKKMTGAKVLAMPGDIPALEEGGTRENFLPDLVGPIYPPVKVDGELHDGQKLELGGTTLVAHLMPGHTPGCTTWTTDQEENGKKYTVVIYGACYSINQPLIGNKEHPNVVQDFTDQYRRLHEIHGDVLLGVGSYKDMARKAEERDKNPGTNPFIDPKTYNDFVAKRENIFLGQLKREIDTGALYPINIGVGDSCPQDGRTCYNVLKLILDCCAKIGAKYVGKD